VVSPGVRAVFTRPQETTRVGGAEKKKGNMRAGVLSFLRNQGEKERNCAKAKKSKKDANGEGRQDFEPCKKRAAGGLLGIKMGIKR